MGVSREVAEEALDGVDEGENAYRAASRVLRRLGQLDYDTFRKKLAAHLRRQGFSPETVRVTVRRLWQELSADPAYGHKDGHAYGGQPEDVA